MSPAELYARAVLTLLHWKDSLVEPTLWCEVRDSCEGLPPRILCVLEGVAPSSLTVEASYPSTSVSIILSFSSVWTESAGSNSSSAGASFLRSARTGEGTPMLEDS